jgi:hypothetical protein
MMRLFEGAVGLGIAAPLFLISYLAGSVQSAFPAVLEFAAAAVTLKGIGFSTPSGFKGARPCH